MSTPNGQQTPIEPVALAKECQAHCFGPEGPGSRIKAQMDRWIGAVALAGKAIGWGFGLLAIAVTVSLALLPSLVRYAVATSTSQVVPGLVDSAVTAALRRHGIAEREAQTKQREAIVQAPPAPWLFPQAHAETKGTPP